MDAITLAYSSLGLQCIIRVRAIPPEASPIPRHGPAWCPFCKFVRRAGWASPSTFVRFYNLDAFTWSIHTIWTPGINLRDDTQATDDPMAQPVLNVFSWLPWVLLPHGVESFHIIAWHDCTCSHTSTFDAVRVKYRKGTYSVTIVTSVTWDVEWVLRSWQGYELHSSVASFEEIWDAVAKRP